MKRLGECGRWKLEDRGNGLRIQANFPADGIWTSLELFDNPYHLVRILESVEARRYPKEDPPATQILLKLFEWDGGRMERALLELARERLVS